MEFLILCGIALVISAIGFYKFVYFISLGYGFSIAAVGAAMIVLFREYMNPVSLIMCILLIVYGIRLGGYLLVREIKSAAYRNVMKKEIKDGSDMNFFLKVLIWAVCAILYVCEAAPILFRLKNHAGWDVVTIIGAAVMALGIALESAADLQKSAQKKAFPGRFCDKGLYRMVRCPNYLGEVLCWTGVFLSGVTALNGAWQWIAAVFGYVSIVYIMFGGARRLEIRQNKNYGQDPEYQKYVKKTPILLPFIPLYSVEKYTFLKG